VNPPPAAWRLASFDLKRRCKVINKCAGLNVRHIGNRREKGAHNLGFIVILLGLVVLRQCIKKATKEVLWLVYVEEVGERHAQDRESGCPAYLSVRVLAFKMKSAYRFFMALLLNTRSNSARDIRIV
jgi:hypothetical protein